MTRADRIAGCLYGAAIGDALGSAFEFVNAASIERHVGEAFVREYRPAMRGSLLYPRAPGKPTDDTAMALAVAGTIAIGEPLTAEAFARRFLADLERGTGRYAEMFWHGGPGERRRARWPDCGPAPTPRRAATPTTAATARRCARIRWGSCGIAMRRCVSPRCRRG